MSEREKSSKAEMVGEFLREIAVLVLVFLPIEFYKGPAKVDPLWLLYVVVGCIVLLTLGILIERIRS